MNLVIVESPTKAKTISRFLTKDFLVQSSNGHVRDLPKSTLGIDLENNFQPKYIIPTKARKTVTQLKKAAKDAELIVLATDEDREGEAIAWHLIQALNLNSRKKIQRIAFHEITEKAINEALQQPRELDLHLVNAQQARRILDRLVGYQLSPFLWKKIAKGLSAGRVQSVAVRLIVDRAREINHFKPQEYWSLEALVKKTANADNIAFNVSLFQVDNQVLDKFTFGDQAALKPVLEKLKDATYQIHAIQSKTVNRNPVPPFITSTLQQEAGRKLGWPAKKTMFVAQQLYEGLELDEKGPIGLITYMRTDSLNISSEALRAAQQFIQHNFGPNYALPQPRIFKTRSKNAQEAHEAIRPTQINYHPDQIKKYLDATQFKLYNLIWRRFVSSQMAPATVNQITIEVKANNCLFKTVGSTIKFDGWLKIYPNKFQETILPSLKIDEILELVELKPQQHFTQPPAKYSEALLIKTLEEYGIGRPSTYAPILSTIQSRGYVIKDSQRKFEPTDIGFTVTDLLIEHFPQIIEIKFTARLEDDLDQIATGQITWEKMIQDFYEPFAKILKEKYTSVQTQKFGSKTDRQCPQCGGQILIKQSRFGKFYACANFPNCRFTESINNSTGVKCPKCQQGDVVEKRTKKRRVFYGCNKYPQCDFSLWDKPIDQKCPVCGALMIQKRNSVVCSNKDCSSQKNRLSKKN